MSDEAVFHDLLVAAGSFLLVKEPRFEAINPSYPGTEIEIDNLAQKRTTLFVFEGSRGKPDVSQIRARFVLFTLHKMSFISRGFLLPYSAVRVFYYNLKRHRLIEFDKKGAVIQTRNFDDFQELLTLLRNI